MKPNPIPNSKPFKKGQSGNPNGRPKKLPKLDDLLAECLGEEAKEAKAILLALIKKAKSGDVRAAEIILDRCYGRAKQFITSQNIQQAEIDYTQLSENALKEILNATSLKENDTEN